MANKTIIYNNTYFDSVTLMQISQKIEKISGINNASIMMGTAQNKNILQEVGLANKKINKADNSDLIIAVEADNKQVISNLKVIVDKMLEDISQGNIDKESIEEKPTSLVEAANKFPEANIVSISTPGAFAAAEGLKALKQDKHVFMFSDNVSLKSEIKLKKYAQKKNLLMMGPDCGTALIGGVPFGFANNVNSGNIGVIGASGTGIQEIMSIIHRRGRGFTQVIGTGSRDLYKKVGGITMLNALEELSKDPNTETILLVSKPPADEIADNIIKKAENIDKKVVICFLGYEKNIQKNNLIIVDNLENAALASLDRPFSNKISNLSIEISSEKYVRGLYSGGTLAYETYILLKQIYPNIYSNIALNKKEKLSNQEKSKEHTILDLGVDYYTKNQPHPMIDLSTKISKMEEEANDPEVGAIIMDIVLGYNAHEDPSSEISPVIKDIVEKNDVEIVIDVVGTDIDPQNYTRQVDSLRKAGAIITQSNFDAVKTVLKKL